MGNGINLFFVALAALVFVIIVVYLLTHLA